MQFWQSFLANPSGQQSMDDFAKAMDGIPKTVFSHTITNTQWDSAQLATNELEKVVVDLKQQTDSDKPILIGSRSLIIQLLNLRLIDELQLCIHPMLEGKGLSLFDQIEDRIVLSLEKTKVFDAGSIVLYYKPIRE